MPLPDRPPFQLSNSRIDSLESCPRRLGWQLYSWGGWNADAAPRCRTSYLLGRLVPSLDAGFGTAVHRLSERFARAAVAGDELPGRVESVDFLEGEIDRLLQMRSFDAFVEDPKGSPMLREVWYGGGVPEKTLERVRSRVWPVVQHITASDVWEEVALGGLEDGWNVYIEEFGEFTFEGVPVQLRVDFAMHRPPFESVLLMDFKTGGDRDEDGSASASLINQMLLYALWCRDALGAEDPEYWSVRGINWVTGHQQVIPITEARLRQAEERLRRSIRLYRRYHSPETHMVVPVPAFEPASPEMREDLCGGCAFTALCVGHMGLRVPA